MLINLASQYAPWLPSRLFANGQQGVWYVPQPVYRGDQVLYQDSAGTTPVTADGDPVGYMQDLSGNGNHATQSTSASRPIYRTDGALHWLEFDGVDDSMGTSSVDFSASPLMSAFLAARKLRSVSFEAVFELSSNSNNFNSIYSSSESDKWNFGLGDSAGSFYYLTKADSIPPVTSVLSAVADRSLEADEISARIDGGGGFLETRDDNVGGNFANEPIFIGSRGGATLPFWGNLYGMVLSGYTASSADIDSAERHLANLAGITL